VLKGTVVGEEYYPLGHTQFGSLINKIKLQKPDVVYAIIVGGSNVSFYKQLKAAGVTAEKQTLLTISVTEDELLGIGGENMVGFFAAMKYFQSLGNENNKAFVKAFKAKYGEKSVIGDVTQAGYLGPWLWKAAVEKAGSSRSTKWWMRRRTSSSPRRPKATSSFTRTTTCGASYASAKVRTDGQFDVLYESGLIEPNPFPEGYQ
jgi:urea transport system substrate-binding protein